MEDYIENDAEFYLHIGLAAFVGVLIVFSGEVYFWLTSTTPPPSTDSQELKNDAQSQDPAMAAVPMPSENEGSHIMNPLTTTPPPPTDSQEPKSDTKSQSPAIAAVPMSSEDEGSHIMNPLTMDVNIQRILNFLPYDDLRNCFSVCRKWRNASFKESKSRVYLGRFGCIRPIKKLYKELLSKSSNEPMKLTKLNIYDWSQDSPRLSLNLISSVVLTAEHMKPQDIFNALKQLPNLSELQLLPLPHCWNGESLKYPLLDSVTDEPYVFPSIRYLEFFSENSSMAETIRLTDFVATFPNLVALSVVNLGPEISENFKDISFAKLKHLRISVTPHVDMEVADGSFEMLSKLDLKLRRLQFKFFPGELVDSNFFKVFVETQKNTLEELEIVQQDTFENPCHHSSNINPFPLDLPHLKMLRISKAFIHNLIPIFDYLPSLEEARICVPTGYDWKGVLPQKINKVYPHLQVLRVDHMQSSMFETLSQYFPSLKVLQVNHCDDIDDGLFDPAAIVSEGSCIPTITMCELCHTYNISLTSTSVTDPVVVGQPHRPLKYAFTQRNSKISKALEHCTQIETLIAGNCRHSEVVIYSIMDKEQEQITDVYLEPDVIVETMGFKSKFQWTMWEAMRFVVGHPHAMKAFNGVRWGGPSLESIWIPFNNPGMDLNNLLTLKYDKNWFWLTHATLTLHHEVEAENDENDQSDVPGTDT